MVSRTAEKAIYEKFQHRCEICGRETGFDEGEVDHIKPKTKGGTDKPNNLQWLCHRCNKLKGSTRTNDEVRELLIFEEKGKTSIMAKGKLIGIEKAEDIVKREVEKRVTKGEVTDIKIESIDPAMIGNILVYRTKCYALVTFRTRRERFLESKGKKYFEVQVHAESGEVIGFTEGWYEPM